MRYLLILLTLFSLIFIACKNASSAKNFEMGSGDAAAAPTLETPAIDIALKEIA